MKEIQDKLVKITAVLAAEAAGIAAGIAPPSPVPGATPKNLADGQIKEKELEDECRFHNNLDLDNNHIYRAIFSQN